MLSWTLLKLFWKDSTKAVLEIEIKSHDIGQLFFDGSKPLGISIFCLFGKHFRFQGLLGQKLDIPGVALPYQANNTFCITI